MPANPTTKTTVNFSKLLKAENDKVTVLGPNGRMLTDYTARFEIRHCRGEEYSVLIIFEKEGEVDEKKDVTVDLGVHRFRQVVIAVEGEFIFPPVEDLSFDQIVAACVVQSSTVEIQLFDEREYEIVINSVLFFNGQTTGELDAATALKLIGRAKK